jgi:hypothetical protein
MTTPFGPHEPLLPPSVAADGGSITVFDERVDVMGSTFAGNRPHLLIGMTVANLGAACVGIGFSTVKVSGCPSPIEVLLSRPQEFGSAT